ncbi:MAG: hypothetical protein Q8M92_09380, partial [Candidatus Subteraquimicrobiales bacterium]|nr:hypothetical protein [Candidatus Subteraquimicrobiales bacterium]
MVSSEEIKQKLGNTREGTPINGYLVCDKCKGYYELQEGENPSDYDLDCDCGGKIRYSKNID